MPNEEKPPTQTVGIGGIDSTEYGIDSREHSIDFGKLMHNPKFQMYSIEISKNPAGCVMDWIENFVVTQCKISGSTTLFDSYSAWHDKKGYWPNETVYGDIIANLEDVSNG